MKLAQVYVDKWGDIGKVDIIEYESPEAYENNEYVVLETLPFQQVGFQFDFDYDDPPQGGK